MKSSCSYEVPSVRWILEMARRGGLPESPHITKQREEWKRTREERETPAAVKPKIFRRKAA